MKRVLNFTVLLIVFHLVSSVLLAQTYKIKQITTIAGQKAESTVYVKNPRKRTESGSMMGMGGDVATIEQCDLKRNVKVSDKKKLYFVEPFATQSTASEAAPTKTPPSAPKITKGGTITVTSSVNDTGERKQMFGLTARRIKTSMKVVSSPDACTPSNTKMDIDGWYVDLPQFSCPVNIQNMTPYQPAPRSGCQDKTITHQTGTGKLGFPLSLTQTMDSGGGESFTQTVETLEFSKATLADALFDVPADYLLAKQEQDLYGRPDIASMMQSAQAGDDEDDKPATKSMKDMSSPIAQKKPGVKRIGVLVPAGATDESLSTAELQEILVTQLRSKGLDAVPIRSEAEASSLSCDYILTNNFSKFKQSAASKVGGLFGKITNTDTSSEKSWDTQVDYMLASTSDSKNVVKNKATLKTSGAARQAAEALLALEVSSVAAAAR